MRRLYGGITDLIDNKLEGKMSSKDIGVTYLEIKEGLPHLDSKFIEKNLEKLVLKGYLVDKEYNGEFFKTDKELGLRREIAENIGLAIVGGVLCLATLPCSLPYMLMVCSGAPKMEDDI